MVESELGHRLDVRVRAAVARWETDMRAKTIRYVEDNELNRKIVRDMLNRTTYSLIEAFDGEAGIA